MNQSTLVSTNLQDILAGLERENSSLDRIIDFLNEKRDPRNITYENMAIVLEPVRHGYGETATKLEQAIDSQGGAL